VASIDKDLFDSIVVLLKTSNQFERVHATVKDSQKGTAAQLRKGKAIAVRCVGAGMIMGSPMLNDCVIQ
jgi:hypothetical protein